MNGIEPAVQRFRSQLIEVNRLCSSIRSNLPQEEVRKCRRLFGSNERLCRRQSSNSDQSEDSHYMGELEDVALKLSGLVEWEFLEGADPPSTNGR